MRKVTPEEVENHRRVYGTGLMESTRALQKIRALEAVDDIKALDNNESNIKDILRYLVQRT